MIQIKQLLKKQNISLSRFINFCLYQKNKGFYQNNRIGSHFITSPEISQMFGECITIFFLLLKKFQVRNYCELGPGNGTLMRDFINTLKKFLKIPTYFFLYEKSIYLSSIQSQNLKGFDSKFINIEFINKLNLKKEPYFFICNEFLDALPINQFEKINNIWFERRVIYDKGFKITNVKTDEKFDSKYLNGDVLEKSPLAKLYLNKIFNHIKEFGGGMLIFDYGPFKKGNVDTLQAIYKSKKCNLFDYPFKSDITYHVDFEMITHLAKSKKLNTFGPITQKNFLFFHGINERVAHLSKYAKSSRIKLNLEKQFERLTNPDGIGNLIKCLFVSTYDIKSKIFKKNE